MSQLCMGCCNWEQRDFTQRETISGFCWVFMVERKHSADADEKNSEESKEAQQ